MKQAIRTARASKFYTILLTVVASISTPVALFASEDTIQALNHFEKQLDKGVQALEQIFIHGSSQGIEKVKTVELVKPPVGKTELESRAAKIIHFVNTEFSKVSNLFKQHSSHFTVLAVKFKDQCDINKLLATVTQSLKDLYEYATCIGDTVVAQKAKDLLHYLGSVKEKWSKTSIITKLANLKRALP